MDKGGQFAFIDWHGAPASLIRQCSPPAESLGMGVAGNLVQCFSQHGYTQRTSYQPVTRFWPFQWIEGGWLLAPSVLLIAATIWLVRRRAA